MLSKKGQEGAPFELLVAVIVMGFVLIAGYRVIQLLQFEECRGNLDNNLEVLKTAIENVAQGEGQRTVSFDFPVCFPQETSKLEVIHRTDQHTCQNLCPGARIECTILAFTTEVCESSEGCSNWKCLKISSATDFPSESVCDDFGDDYDVDQWKVDPIQPGQYILVKKFNEFSAQPRICVYRRQV